MREVDTLGIAYHSPALEPFSAELRAGEAPSPIPTCHRGRMVLPGTLCWERAGGESSRQLYM